MLPCPPAPLCVLELLEPVFVLEPDFPPSENNVVVVVFESIAEPENGIGEFTSVKGPTVNLTPNFFQSYFLLPCLSSVYGKLIPAPTVKNSPISKLKSRDLPPNSAKLFTKGEMVAAR